MSNFVDKFTNTFFPKNLWKYFNGSKRYNMNFLSSITPSYIDVAKAWEVYCTIPHLNVVINTKASMLSNMHLYICDENGDRVEGMEEYYDFLAQPNPLQSFKEWISQLSILEDLYGNGFVYPLVGSSLQEIPSAMWNLPSEYMKVNKTGKLFEQSKIEDIIKSYELDMPEYHKLYKPNELVHTNNNDSSDYFIGTSKLEPLCKNLSVIDAVLKTANILYSERGGIWMFSHDSKGEMGSIPLGKNEKDEIIKQYEMDYGIHEGQKRYVLTNASMKATPISFPIKDLMMNEQIENDFATIIAMYGMDRDLFPSTKGATKENKVQATKLTYQNTIQPIADDKAKMLTKIMKLDAKGYHFKASYEHLPVMQEDEKLRADVEKINADRYITLYDKNLININELRKALGFEEIDLSLLMSQATTSTESSEGEQLSTPEAEDQNAIAQANLRGSVGGVQGILQIQQSFVNGVTSESSAISILQEIYGFSEETARQILGI